MTAVDLCFNCRWMPSTGTRGGWVWCGWGRAEDDARYVRYPPLPVLACPGYEEAMLFVVLMHYSQPLEAVDRIRAEHVRHVEGWAERGVFRAWARRNPPSGGVLVAAAPGRAALERVGAEGPDVKGGVATPEVVEVNPANARGRLGRQ